MTTRWSDWPVYPESPWIDYREQDLFLVQVYSSPSWNCWYWIKHELGTFSPIYFIRSLYNGRQYLNYKSSVELICHWIDSRQPNLCDTCHVFCLQKTSLVHLFSHKTFLFFFFFNCCASPTSDQRASLNITQGGDTQVYCIVLVWF